MTSLLSPAQAARALCVSEKQLRALTCAGLIRYINIGLGQKRETRRYDPEDLREFLESRKCQSIGAKAKRPTATTSNTVAIDFLAQLAARRKGKPNAGKHGRRNG